MSKTPTAEEVLDQYREWQECVEELTSLTDFSNGAFIRAMKLNNEAVDKFHAIMAQWQAAQCPVTREWFYERFGSTVIYLDDETAICHIDYGTCILIQDGIEDRSLSNITCNQIEILVKVLGNQT